MSLDYVHEKLSDAVTSIATSTDRLQDRLAHAYINGFHPLRPADFPSNLRPQYQKILGSLTNVPAQDGEGTVVATTRIMSDNEASSIIEQLVELYDEVTQLVGKDDNDVWPIA